MEIAALGYVGVGSNDLTGWSEFATDLLGMQMVERGNACRAFRMDDRKQRLVIDASLPAHQRYFGWEVADAAALDRLAARLEDARVAVRREPSALASQRCVAELISFADPSGNRLEAFHGAEISSDPFRPGRTISGFRTGALGMGHVLLIVTNLADSLAFYRDLLGFGVSDYMTQPFHAYFLHVNPRHDSLALVEGHAAELNHVMVELFSLDDVGQGYDIAMEDSATIAQTLGRHTNDWMTSFYVRSPGGFRFEYGWGGREVDPGNWQAVEITHGPSLWGHDAVAADPEMRTARKRLREAAARDGLRAPVQVMSGNHTVMRGVCPWWDAAAGRNG